MVEIVIERIRAKQLLTELMYDAISQHTYVPAKKEILVAGKGEELDSGIEFHLDLEAKDEDCYRVEYSKYSRDFNLDVFCIFDVVDRFVENERLYERLRLNDKSFLDECTYNIFEIGISKRKQLDINWNEVLINHNARLASTFKETRHYESSYFIELDKDSYIEDLTTLLIAYKDDICNSLELPTNYRMPSIKRITGEDDTILECYYLMHYESTYHIHMFFRLKEIKVSNETDKIFLEVSYNYYPPYSSRINSSSFLCEDRSDDGTAIDCYPKGYNSIDKYLYKKKGTIL